MNLQLGSAITALATFLGILHKEGAKCAREIRCVKNVECACIATMIVNVLWTIMIVHYLLERAVNVQLLHHLQLNGLLPEHQSAYRKSRSTESALLKVTSDALKAADEGKVTLLGMLYLSAAFDCVDHQIFLKRLTLSFGIVDVAVCWISSYLTERCQKVRYNGSVSEMNCVTYGVPQGSVLGPLFFLIYTADVFHMADRHGFRIHDYADDLQIYDHVPPTGIGGLVDRFIVCIEDVRRWMMDNRLRLNTSKTQVIWLGSTRRLSNCSLDSATFSISGELIKPVDKVRNLGVILDSGLTFEKHISVLVSSCYYHLRQLRTIRKALTQDS